MSPATWLLVPFVLGVALALAIALGPAGDPSSLRRREGGVSRALAARAAADHRRNPEA